MYPSGSLGRGRAGNFSRRIRLQHLPIAYGRGATLDDRLSIWPQLRDAVFQPGCIVIDPDSRLTQLLACFRCAAREGVLLRKPLVWRRWRGTAAHVGPPLGGSETFGVADGPYVDAQPYIATGLDAAEYACAVSFGVGEDPGKQWPILSKKSC